MMRETKRHRRAGPRITNHESLPTVSVIVPVFNAAGTLPVTLPALLDQPAAEILLVDDGSTDGTGAVLRAMTEGHATARVLTHAANRGRAAARNTGIAEATGAVLLFLDADMRPAPDFVRQHALLHRDPAVVGVVSRPMLEGLDPADPYHRYLRWQNVSLAERGEQPVHFKYFIIGYTSVKADAVRAVGGFDERFTYGEDLDLAIRLARHAPGGLVYSPRPVVHHYAHGDLDARLRKLRAFGRDNLPLLLAKHPEAAAAANLDFVDSPHARPTAKALLKRWALRPGAAAAARMLLSHAPARLGNALVRYLLANAVADAYRSAPQSDEQPDPRLP